MLCADMGLEMKAQPPSPKDDVMPPEAPPSLLPSLEPRWPQTAYGGLGLLGVSITWWVGGELSELPELSEDVSLSSRVK